MHFALTASEPGFLFEIFRLDFFERLDVKADLVPVVVHVPAVMAAFVFGEGDDLPVEVALDVLVARFEVGVLEDREGGFFRAL